MPDKISDAIDIMKRISDAIDNCRWRQDFDGIRICSGDVTPCFKHIEDGKCSMLIKLFEKMIKEDSTNGQQE